MNAEQILHGLIIRFVILVIVKKKKRIRKRSIGQGIHAFIIKLLSVEKFKLRMVKVMRTQKLKNDK